MLTHLIAPNPAFAQPTSSITNCVTLYKGACTCAHACRDKHTRVPSHLQLCFLFTLALAKLVQPSLPLPLVKAFWVVAHGMQHLPRPAAANTHARVWASVCKVPLSFCCGAGSAGMAPGSCEAGRSTSCSSVCLRGVGRKGQHTLEHV